MNDHEIPIAVPIKQRHRAYRISRAMPKPDGGRLYILAFKHYYKLGRSARLAERFNDILGLRRRAPFRYALIGPEHSETKRLEKFILNQLAPWLYRELDEEGCEYTFDKTREYFYSSPGVEAILTNWFRSGYEELEGLDAVQDEEADSQEVEREASKIEVLLSDLDECWSFDNGQGHTHSWHDKQDFMEKWRNAVARSRGITSPQALVRP